MLAPKGDPIRQRRQPAHDENGAGPILQQGIGGQGRRDNQPEAYGDAIGNGDTWKQNNGAGGGDPPPGVLQ